MSAATTEIPEATEAPGGPATYVVTLTDEELAALGHAEGVAVLPYLADLDDTASDLVQATALRGLVARGIVSPPEGGDPRPEVAGDRAEVDLLVRQDVLSVLTLRRAAPVAVAVARAGAATQDFWYAHVVEEYVLLEEVTPDGQHRFALARTASLGGLVEAAVLHPEAAAAADGSEAPVTLRVPAGAGQAAGDLAVATAPPELMARLGAAYLRSDVVVVRRDRGERAGELLGVFSGPTGCWTSTAVAGSGTVEVVATTPDALRARLGSLTASVETGGPR
ncbi:hypothetical protein RDV89_07425 [Nocardioides zeae]|uniref:ESX secretion-associated protein EspG n=1 Tax=Nocardioides imazamoxiresistens TaxID=3231893 RepID=A0ABU3PUI7_9ACTN|nr:hypothetical protein [Nocardioides zeae]MDT9592893.1 hypothetical protein [Nocardioides zeae]